ncbi:putative phosphoesterase [Acetonema longum DSM 6540]|uniref:Phosphoesterase n=2 Tax=Acetonema TaxID=2373 RepID=F7NGN2_9FIRM|nr:putative phosphoesterase [Acetonema longum DSM 6540]
MQLENMDLIIYAGDYTDCQTVERLQDRGRFAGVWGNGDPDDIRALLPEKTILPLGPYRMGIFHGHGTSGSTPQRAYDMFKEDAVDMIVFGHSHQPAIFTKKGVLMLNPGSPTNKRQERWFSYILLELAGSRMEARLIMTENPPKCQEPATS